MRAQDARRTLAVLLAAITMALAAPRAGAIAAPPNVVLITVDTLRADHLHTYGFPLATSPSIDALAADSIVFERAISASGYTGPSHAAIMTSKYPRHHSMGYSNGQRRLSGERTLADVFRQAGYSTAAFVSNSVVGRASGFDQGFQTFNDELPQAELNRPAIHERNAEQTTGAALAWLQTVGSGPFFLWVHYQDPHGPYTPPQPYRDQFHVAADGQPALRVLEDESGYGGVPHYQRLEGLDRLAQYESRYAGEIAYADHWIGILLASAREHSGSGGPIVVLTADHGESFGEDGYYLAHGHSTTPELSHVPFIVRVPGHPAARRRQLASHVDVMPTLLDAAGGPVPPGTEGLSLLRHAANDQRTVYCDIGYELSAYRADRFLRALFASSKSWDLAMSYQTGRAPAATLADLKVMQTFQWDGGAKWSQTRRDEVLERDLRAYVNGG